MKINLFGYILSIEIKKGYADMTKKELKNIVKQYTNEHPESNPVFCKIEAINYYRNKIEKLTGNRIGLKEAKERIEALLFKWKLV